MTNNYSQAKIIIGTMRLGSWGAGFSTDDYERFIDACLDLGLNEFDHADIYGAYTTEEEFGRVLKRRSDLAKKLRITTKCGIMMPVKNKNSYTVKHYNSSGKHIIESVDRSLAKLGLEQLDTLLLHRPDYFLDADEVSEAVLKLKKEGKIKNFGISNHSYSQVSYIASRIDLTVHQVEISLSNPNAFHDGTIDLCKEMNIAITAWSPLGGGEIFGSTLNEKQQRIRNCAEKMSKKYSCTLDQILISWLTSHNSGIIPVIGTSKIERVERALKASEIILEREDWYALLEESLGHEPA